MYLMYFHALCSKMLARKLLKTLECFMYQVCMLPVPLARWLPYRAAYMGNFVEQRFHLTLCKTNGDLIW